MTAPLRAVTGTAGLLSAPRPMDALIAEIEAHRAAPAHPTWADLGRFYGVNKAVLWRVCHSGYEPMDQGIRARLGLPLTLEPTFVRCACGTRYVPNVPWRRRCYLCSPPRK